MDMSYRIKYKKDNLEIEVQGDKNWVDKKFTELIEKQFVEEEALKRKPSSRKLPGSIIEFLKEKGAQNYTDRIIVFCYWLVHSKGYDSYNADDIYACYSEARISPPANINSMMNHLQGKGYLLLTKEKEGKKAWVITQTGEEYVENMQ